VLDQLPGCRIIDVVPSDLCDEDQEKYDYARSISKRNTMRFRLVQTLSESNSLRPVLMYYAMKNSDCPTYVAGCYLYNRRTVL
jgi:hypothetical protein